MPGWNLTEGNMSTDNVSDEEFWTLFNYVFSDSCKKTNTYKFGLIKSICDQVYDLRKSESGYYLSYEMIFSKFAENYWNLVIKYKLKQSFYNGKSLYSKIEMIIRDIALAKNIPEDIIYSSINELDKREIIKTATKECKKYVIGALYNDFEGKLYSFRLRDKGIYLSHCAYDFISKYKLEIEKLNYYAWARFLEKTNDDEAMIRVLEKLDLATPKRTDLSIYREILIKEFCENTCFYCGKELKRKIHVDHFIPWTFVKSDNLWNLVLACPKCNLKKKDKLPTQEYIVKINKRNELHVEDENIIITKEFSNYSSDLVNRMWVYAHMSGLKENE